MTVNGVTLPDPDVGDPGFVERFENAQEAVLEKMSALTGKWSEKIRRQCTAVFEFFDDVFGAGTAKTVFGDVVNLRTCIDAYEEAVNGIQNLDKDLGAYFRNKAPGNRSQRRDKKHKKKQHKK